MPTTTPRYPSPAAGAPPAALGMTALPPTYVLLPQRLIEDLRDAPVAIGAYALIARLFLITGEAVPLSPGDLRAYDPALSYGAARRALTRLAADGYALAEKGCGHKTRYRPTWGQVHDTPLPWDRAGAGLGRPRHIRAVRLDDRLLDLCQGRLRPHPAHRALVERYLAAPLLGLQEIGAYALALGGVPAPSPALRGLGLLSAAGAALPLPDDRTVLALASQRATRTGGAGGLTAAGWRRAGLAPAADSAPASVEGEVLFFVPAGVIGEVIAPADEGHAPSSALIRQEPPLPAQATGSHGSDRDHGSSTTPSATASEAAAGGGGETPPQAPAQPADAREPAERPAHPHPPGPQRRAARPLDPPLPRRPLPLRAARHPGAPRAGAPTIGPSRGRSRLRDVLTSRACRFSGGQGPLASF